MSVCFVLYKSGAFRTLIAISPFLTCFPYHRSPSVCLEGTHGVRSAWGHANAIDFVTIASSLCATSSTRIDRDNSLVIPPSFVRRLRNNTAQSDGTTVKLGAQILAAAAARVPSANKHIPLISALRTNVRSGVGVPPATATKLQYHLRKAQISLLPRATISRTLCVHITYIALRLVFRLRSCTYRV